MPLSSPAFVFLFLPVALAGFFAAGRIAGQRTALGWICLLSLAFYLGWNPQHGWVLALSLGVNYAIALWLAQAGRPHRKAVLVAGIVANAGFLAVFKVLAGGIWGASGSFSAAAQILIPLAISFITFQQIAFLLDVYRQRVRSLDPLDYLAFILFFPQLVMGPIVHYRDMAPQFHRAGLARFDAGNVSVGLAIFIVGLFKKLVLADSLAPYVNDGYARVPDGLGLLDAWTVAVGFQLQLYFDFSGYADMAIGIARMFNIHLPINFDSPYRATDRFDQWRRWHISFSAFMRQYIFFPLSRNRWIPLNATQALFITALFSGFWHGFGSTFLLWGLAQALLMLGIHWRKRLAQRLTGMRLPLRWPAALPVFTTFFVTVMLGILFRSPDLATAAQLYRNLVDLSSLQLPLDAGTRSAIGAVLGVSVGRGSILLDGMCGMLLLVAAFTVWCLPNTQQVFRQYWQAGDQRHEKPKDTWPGFLPVLNRLCFRPDARWAVVLGLMLAACITCMDRSTRFIYYQF